MSKSVGLGLSYGFFEITFLSELNGLVEGKIYRKPWIFLGK